MEIAVSAGADDIETMADGSIEVTTQPTNFEKIAKAFQDARLQPELSEIVQRATTDCPLNLEDSDKIMNLISSLEELDDVQDVFTNATFPEEYDPVL